MRYCILFGVDKWIFSPSICSHLDKLSKAPWHQQIKALREVLCLSSSEPLFWIALICSSCRAWINMDKQDKLFWSFNRSDSFVESWVPMWVSLYKSVLSFVKVLEVMNSLPLSFETKIFHCPEFLEFEYLHTSCFADFEGLYTYLEALPKGDLEGPASGFLRHFSNHRHFVFQDFTVWPKKSKEIQQGKRFLSFFCLRLWWLRWLFGGP